MNVNAKPLSELSRLIKCLEIAGTPFKTEPQQLITTGTLTVKLTQEQREECFALGEKTASEVVDYFLRRDAEIDKLDSVLPDSPDVDKINNLLYEIRRENM